MFSGKYLPIIRDTSGRPILFFINVTIRKNISIIAIKNTNDENLLKNITTTTINKIKIIKSIYILLTYYFILLIFYHFNIFFSREKD